MTGKVRFGIIGCGRMGLRRIKTVVSHPRAELIFISDNNEELAMKIAKERNCDCYPELEKASRCPNVDCIIVSTPNKFHSEAVILALEAGKHVFCEKPLCRNPEEGIRMFRTAMSCGKTLKVGSNLRYFPSVLKAKELLSNDAIGSSVFIRGWVGNNGWQLKSWFSDHDVIGGGTFLDNGSHLLDIYRWFMGEVEECTGFVATNYWPVAPLEDNAMGIFKFRDGQLGFLHSSWMEWTDYMYLEVYGTDGYIRVDNRNPNSTTVLGSKNGLQQTFDYSRLTPQSYDLEFDDYVDAIINGRQPSPNGFDGLRAVQMAYAVYESSQSGRKVKLWGEIEESLYRAFLGPKSGDR